MTMRAIGLAGLILLGVSATSHAAIIPGTTTTSIGNGTSASFDHAVAAGSNLLVVTVAGESISAGAVTVTYDGAPMTPGPVAATTTGNFSDVAAIFYLFKPAAGLNSVSITGVGDTSGSGNSPLFDASASDFGNISASLGVIDTATAANQSTEQSSVTLNFDASAATGQALLFVAVDTNQEGNGPVPTTAGGISAYEENRVSNVGPMDTGAGYRIVDTPTASEDLAFAWGSDADYALTGLAFSEVIPEPASLALLGLGGLVLVRRR